MHTKYDARRTFGAVLWAACWTAAAAGQDGGADGAPAAAGPAAPPARAVPADPPPVAGSPDAALPDGASATKPDSPTKRFFDLGEIHVREFRPPSNEVADVRFTMHILLDDDADARDLAALEQVRHRLRDQAIVAARLAATADYAEPTLDALLASILRRMKRAFPELPLQQLYLSAFSASAP